MIGNLIRTARTNEHLTQVQLACMAGTTRANIAKIEGNAYVPSMYLALNIFRQLQELKSQANFLEEILYGHDRESHGRRRTRAKKRA